MRFMRAAGVFYRGFVTDRACLSHTRTYILLTDILLSRRTFKENISDLYSMSNIMKLMGCLLTALLASAMRVGPALSQSIIPSTDGTSTIVTHNRTQFDIGGGQLSRDGTNLFHSFTRLGLSQGEIANFLSNPKIQNILGRVVGGDASIIDGLLRVSGGNSNLYLMNPSGIVFGPNARLDLPGSFTATTANGIGFGSNWFNALGPSNYADLVGIPSAFAFTMAQPGGIINNGNLTVASGQNLSLLGGTVVSTGQLSAPQGQIIVSSVPGTSAIRVRPVGQLLSYEIQPLEVLSSQPTPWTMPISSLAELLTGKNDESKPQVAPGDVAVRQLAGQTATISAAQNLKLVESQLNTTGDLTLTAQNTVLVRDNVANPFIAHAQGNLYIQGNQGINILALNHPITPFQSGGNLSLVSEGIISGDSHFASGGNFSIHTLSGTPGKFVSFYDPIISSNGDVSFGDYTGVALKVEARGSINGGNIRITGPDTSLSGSDPDISTLTSSPALILRAGLTALVNPPNIPQTQQGTTFTSPGGPSLNGGITVGNIDTSSLTGNGGPVLLNAVGNLEIKNVNTGTGGIAPTVTVESTTDSFTTTVSGGYSSGNGSGGNISLTSRNGNISTGSLLSFANSGEGSVQVDAFGNVALGEVNSSVTSNGNPGSISITARNGNISTGNLFAIASLSNPGNGASIQLSSGSNVATGNISSIGNNGGNGGTVQVSSVGNISAGTISTSGFGSNGGDGGDVVLKANPGNISVGTLYLSSGGVGGNVDISATGAVAIGNTLTFGTNGRNGSIKLSGSSISKGQVNFGFETTILQTASTIPSSKISNVPTNVTYNGQPSTSATPNETAQYVEQSRRDEFKEYFGKDFPQGFRTPESRRFALAATEQQIGIKPATIYASIEGKYLQLVLETSDGAVVKNCPVVIKVKPVKQPSKDCPITAETPQTETKLKDASQTESKLKDAIEHLQDAVRNPHSLKKCFVEPAKQVYQWLIKPLEAELKERKVNTLLFSMGKGLRFIPLAALVYHDDDGREGYLIQKYSISVIPSLDSIAIDNFRYSDISKFQVLPAGVSRFPDRSQSSSLFPDRSRFSSLPAVPIELSVIQNESSSSRDLLLNDFNEKKLIDRLQNRPFRIVHLATHARFENDSPDGSYIQLPAKIIYLKELREILKKTFKGNNKVDLLVLSACSTAFDNTALDNEVAGRSFAAVSVQAGVRSTLASLWDVSDAGAVVLMDKFYKNLRQAAPLKARALQETQRDMSEGNLQLDSLQLMVQKFLVDGKTQDDKPLSGEEAGTLLILNALMKQEPPPGKEQQKQEDNFCQIGAQDPSKNTSDAVHSPFVRELCHPFYWAGFTIVGTPW